MSSKEYKKNFRIQIFQCGELKICERLGNSNKSENLQSLALLGCSLRIYLDLASLLNDGGLN